MNYHNFAKLKFQEIMAASPANECNVLTYENGIMIDCGVDAHGGWMASRAVLEALIGGRGQVSYSERMIDGMQLPAVDLYLDDPVGCAGSFTPDENGILGISDSGEYCLGVLIADSLKPNYRGNVVAARCGSLLDGILEAASAVPAAVTALKEAGITDIQWAWSSCPVANLTDDPAEMAQRKLSMSNTHAVTSIWVRGDDAAIAALVKGYSRGQLRIHNLASAKTFVNE